MIKYHLDLWKHLWKNLILIYRSQLLWKTMHLFIKVLARSQEKS